LSTFIPVSQIAIDILNYLLTRSLPPRTLPKMDFEKSGIPVAFQTLIVVPMILVNEETIKSEVEKLEIRYLANREDNLLFSLFTDFSDADQVRCEDDKNLLECAIKGLEALNQRYGEERFFLFHRERTWAETEQKYIGWERKRGKLEELNGLIAGTRPVDAPRLVYVGDPDFLPNVRFVITLDSDTQLPPGTARRMVETLAHPLNQPRFDSSGRIVPGSYTIVQPRVSPTLPSTSATPFSRLYADAVGIDPYTKAVSDVNQDLAGEGSYHGKGIYDVRAFDRILSGRFPDELLLSHDLIEGSHVRVALATDIELLDEFPRSYLGYTSRQHRWIRGDWQIADWILPWVPVPGGRRGPNELSWFNRWKILDNMRRSLVPVMNLVSLLIAWLTSLQLSWIVSLVIAAQLLIQPLGLLFTAVTAKGKLRSYPQLGHDLLRSFVEAALIPFQAGLAMDAILRVFFRRFISHRNLLEWTTAQVVRWSAAEQLFTFMTSMGMASVFSGVTFWVVGLWKPDNLAIASPWLILWALSPVAGWFLNLQPRAKQKQRLISAKDHNFLRQIARRTWRYFSDFVNEDSSWLPPDNYQVSHQARMAMRTSPTNIGLWMLSALAAGDFGYLTVDQVVDKLNHTLATILKMDRYKGHLFNWYDIRNLAPLEPRYVSTVDSGNLLGALWTLENGLGELFERSVLPRTLFDGLLDTGRILKDTLDRIDHENKRTAQLNELLSGWEAPPDKVIDVIRLLRLDRDRFGLLASQIQAGNVDTADASYWVGQLEGQLSAWVLVVDRYLGWIEILSENADDSLTPLGQESISAIHQILEQPPSLSSLARGEVVCMQVLQSVRDQASPEIESLLGWLDRLLGSYSNSKWLAGEVLGLGQLFIQESRGFSDSVNMQFLYDPERRLFSIGYNVSSGSHDGSYYDLLASEARLGSFVAIARGDAPVEHWFSLGRPYGVVGRRRILLSWSGSMFEYLMPLIFQRSFTNSLLDKAARDAVETQIDFGRQHHVPWGISESGFGDLDINKTYQYKAFGVPSLGLRREVGDEIVVAPYATLLAANVDPLKTVQNLKRLADLGLLNDYGFYEAVDYSRRSYSNSDGKIMVRAYMAHHQGMGFLSLANFLRGNLIIRHFRADPRVRAVEALLHERIPTLPPLHHILTHENRPSHSYVGKIAPSASEFETPHTSTPKTQLLSNGRYGLMVTNAGGGYSQWGDYEITRWRSDRSRDSWGTFCYICEPDLGLLWSNTYHPVGGQVESYSANFTLDRALFRRSDYGIHTETEIIVAQDDDVEIRRITLINQSGRTRNLDLTSYVELSMVPHNVDRQHPAFNKLFIQTEAIPQHRALLAFRRTRGRDDRPFYVAHRFTLEQPDNDPMRFETDRRQFIGRGRSLNNPMGISHELSNSQGFSLDPILSLCHNITLAPGQRTQISMILAASDSRALALKLMDKYGDPHVIDRAMDFAWASAQLELRLLRIQPDEARRFQKLASHLLYPSPLLRPPSDRLKENFKGQAGLWPYGISGDLPIALVTIGEVRDINLVRQMLQAHAYWRMHGLKADLLILNEESSSYEQPLRERLEGLIKSYSIYTGVNQPGGVFLRSSDQIPEEDLTLLIASASVVMVAARGIMPQQLGAPTELPELPEPLSKKPAPRDPSSPLPFMELSYFNGLGGFTGDGREYVIYLGPNTHTPAPWVNVIANPTFGTLVSETGSGFTWYGNSQRNRLTEWSNDPVLDPSSEAIFIRDEDSGIYWTSTPLPVRDDAAYRARHGAGYTVFEHNCYGIEQELTIFVPTNEKGGEPVKLQRLLLKNGSSRIRRLTVTYYAELTLGENRESTQMHIITDWDDEVQAIIARNRYHPEYGDRISFMAMNPPAEAYTGDRVSFIGRNRSLADPAAMDRTGLSKRTGAGLDPCAALQVEVVLSPGATTEVICMLGQTASLEEAHKLILTYSENVSFETTLEGTKSWWDDLFGTIEVHTPELAVDLLVNRWLLYQSLSSRIWGRTAFYQSGGAFGFRDQLQDVMAFLYADPKLAREHILLAASRQFREGDVQHWWHEPGGVGIRSRFSDDLLWLPYAVAQYVRVTGDADILNEQVAFIDGPVLQGDQGDSFFTPQITMERASLFEHCRRAVARGLTSGPHRLPLIGTGDWNDGMNQVGAGGKGESIWLGWFLVDVLQGMSGLAATIGQEELSREYLNEKDELIEGIEHVAWDGEWYLRAIFDDGSPLGSSKNLEARIDSIPQSWSWLSDAPDKQHASQALDSAWKYLVREDDGLVLLFAPPFDKSEPSPGYIQSYPPGVRENGGQYTHAAIWLAIAFVRRDDGSRAAQLLRILNPVERARDPESVWRYRLEPYVVAADVYRLQSHIGQGGWSWYTGSAAWMYRAWIEELLGLKIRGDHMVLEPVIPGRWQGFNIRYRCGEAIYDIDVENPAGVEHGVVLVELDGRRLPNGVIPLERSLVKHHVRVLMGVADQTASPPVGEN
jgi:cyclic beta-1,2-glucan synthetase